MIVLRRATASDAQAVATCHVRSWQVGYRGLLADGYLAGLDPAERAARYTFDLRGPAHPATTLALDGDQLVGFVTIGPRRDTGDGGEVRALYVDPEAWGRGVGRALIAHARAELAARGHAEGTLFVLVGNLRAERFYAADGWRPDGVRRVAEIWGARLDEVQYRRCLG